MNFGPSRIEEWQLDKLFKTLLLRMKRQSKIDDMKKLVNSILPKYKLALLNRFFLINETLNEITLLKYFLVFLDENTKFLKFEHITINDQIIKAILKIIPRYCQKIETIDFTNIFFTRDLKEDIKSFLKQTTSVKSLRVPCRLNNCAIFQLLLEEDFNLLDQDVKTGLLKIEYISGFALSASECVRLLKLLPNLTSFGYFQTLTPVLTYYTDDNEIVQKLSNLTELYEDETSLTTLERFVKFCPKVKKIHLSGPQKNVVENLWKFPLLTEIQIIGSRDTRAIDFVTEIINMLKIIGKQIEILDLFLPDEAVLDRNTIHELCPELINLEIVYDGL